MSKAERQALTVRIGEDESDFADFKIVYESMLQRKRFVPAMDFEAHRRMQRELPEGFKMKGVTCRHGDRLCAAGIFSLMGD